MTISVVVVDDEEIDRYLVKRVVGSIGLDANIVEFSDGDSFVEVIRDKQRRVAAIGEPPPEILVLLDINMPGMDGMEVLERLRRELTAADGVVFVVMHTSSNHAEDRAESMNFDFVKDYVVKPLTGKKLKLIVERLYPDPS